MSAPNYNAMVDWLTAKAKGEWKITISSAEDHLMADGSPCDAVATIHVENLLEKAIFNHLFCDGTFEQEAFECPGCGWPWPRDISDE